MDDTIRVSREGKPDEHIPGIWIAGMQTQNPGLSVQDAIRYWCDQADMDHDESERKNRQFAAGFHNAAQTMSPNPKPPISEHDLNIANDPEIKHCDHCNMYVSITHWPLHEGHNG